MRPLENSDIWTVDGAVEGLLRGDFSRLEPLFVKSSPGELCQIAQWYRQGAFEGHGAALAEAFTCACFLGRTNMAEFLLDEGVDATAGNGTGLDGMHWAANRGQLDTMRLLLRRRVPIETISMYGGTALGTAVWSAINEPRGDQLGIIKELVAAGARVDAVASPTGNVAVDAALRHGER
jgi:ankyrin repeat protein